MDGEGDDRGVAEGERRALGSFEEAAKKQVALPKRGFETLPELWPLAQEMLRVAAKQLNVLLLLITEATHAFGRAQGVVGPGVHFKLPIVQKFVVEETKHTTLDLEPQVIQLDDDLVYEVDAKVMYQIVDLRRAMIEIDDLVTGLQNRVVMAVQRVIQAQTRVTIRDTDAMIAAILDELRPVEEQWGVRIRQFGFSNLSPSPSTLEITQLDLLARERLALYQRLRDEGLSEEATVALVTGAVVATHAEPEEPGRAAARRERERLAERFSGDVTEAVERQKREAKKKKSEASGLGELPDDEGDEGEDAPEQ